MNLPTNSDSTKMEEFVVTIYKLDSPLKSYLDAPRWDAPRTAAHTYTTLFAKESRPDAIADEAFRLTNMPPYELDESQSNKVKGYQSTSLSVGDSVLIEDAKGNSTTLLLDHLGWQSSHKKLLLNEEPVLIVPYVSNDLKIGFKIAAEESSKGVPYLRTISSPCKNISDAPVGKNKVLIQDSKDGLPFGICSALETAGIARKTGRETNELIEMEIISPSLLLKFNNLKIRKIAEIKTLKAAEPAYCDV